MLNVAAKDEQRDLWLKTQGYDVLRIPAAEVMADADEVVMGLLAFIAEKVSQRK